MTGIGIAFLLARPRFLRPRVFRDHDLSKNNPTSCSDLPPPPKLTVLLVYIKMSLMMMLFGGKSRGHPKAFLSERAAPYTTASSKTKLCLCLLPQPTRAPRASGHDGRSIRSRSSRNSQSASCVDPDFPNRAVAARRCGTGNRYSTAPAKSPDMRNEKQRDRVTEIQTLQKSITK